MEDGTYNVVYILITTDGSFNSFIEDAGILPTLFLTPSQENYVSINPYHPDKELEICIPVFDRENKEFPKGNRPFVGDFIGISNNCSIFYDIDVFSDSKPDKMMVIEFEKNNIKKRHSIKIPLPKKNRISISHDEIHLLAKDGGKWIHRQIDKK